MVSVAVMLARPLHVSKVGQSKEKAKTKQATLISDFHAHGRIFKQPAEKLKAVFVAFDKERRIPAVSASTEDVDIN